MSKKIIFSLLSVLILFISFADAFSVNIAHADTWADRFEQRHQERAEEYNEIAIENSGKVTKSPLRDDDDELFYYRLEAGMPDDDKAFFLNILGKVNDGVTVALNETLMAVNNFMFWLMERLTGFLVGFLDFATNPVFVDQAMDAIGDSIVEMVGISGTDFSTNGMFYPLLQLIAISVVVYAFYKLIWKRSFVESFGELLKFIVVLTVSLLLFMNYTTFISGMNNLGTEVSGLIVGSYGGAGDEEIQEGAFGSDADQQSRLDAFGETLWSNFIDEPYLVLMYGTSELSSLAIDDMSGEDRVRELLTGGRGSPQRINMLDEEINDIGNYHMTYDSVVEKTSLTFMFLIVNLIVSIPVFMILLGMLFTQFWFVIIAMIAPFALLIASIPSQFNVLKRYFFELALPLIIRVALSFILVMMMFLMTVVREISATNTSEMFDGAVGTAFLNALYYAMLFIGIFLLRKRIMGIMSSGSEMVGEIRQGMSSVTTEPAKKGVQSAATATGAVVGGVATGGALGVVAGANIGKSAGKMATFDSQSPIQDTANAVYQGQMMKHIGAMGDDNNQNSQHNQTPSNDPNLTPEQKEKQRLDQEQYQMKKGIGEKAVGNFAKQHNMSSAQQEGMTKAFEEEGVDYSKLNDNVLEKYHSLDDMGNVDYPRMASRIKSAQSEQGLKVESMKEDRRKSFDSFLSNQSLTTNEIDSIKDELDSKAIDTAMIPKQVYKKADQNVRTKLEEGDLVDYKKEFSKDVTKQMQARELEKQKARIMNNERSEAEQEQMTRAIERHNRKAPSLKPIQNNQQQSTLRNLDNDPTDRS